jgi:D-glycero-D-manno-heptose 1,7-bisphosphate phosphatase
MSGKPAVFLDRDGVINALVYHQDMSIVDSPFTPEQFCVLRGVPKAVRLLNDLGLPVVIVSNQPGMAKGHFGADLLPKIDAQLLEALRPAKARVDGIYYCLHHPDAIESGLRKRCDCRKPKAGLLRRAARELNLSLPNSYMIGDGLTDMEAGSSVGCTTIFVGSWKCEHCQFIHPTGLRPSLVAKNLWEAARLIERDFLITSKPPTGKAKFRKAATFSTTNHSKKMTKGSKIRFR